MKRMGYGRVMAAVGGAFLLMTPGMIPRKASGSDLQKVPATRQQQVETPNMRDAQTQRIFSSKKDLELTGVEIWVQNEQPGRTLPHLRIYADSELKVVAYFRNSGMEEVELKDLSIAVPDGPVRAVDYLSSNNKPQLVKPKEEVRAWVRTPFRLPAGTHTLRVKIDSTDRLHEFNEGNNEKTIRFDVNPTPPGGIPFADCGVQDFTPKLSAFPLPWHVDGDTDMHGHGPDVYIGGELTQTDTRLVMRGDIRMREDEANWTEFRALFKKVIFQAPQGCRIKKVESSRVHKPLQERGRISGNLKGSKQWKRLYAPRRGAGPQLIQSALCLGDTKGSEAGKIGCKEITLIPLRIHLERVTGPVCVGQTVLLQGYVDSGSGFVGVYPLARTRGDGEMGRSPVKKQVNVSLKSDRNRIWVEHHVQMKEYGGDQSTFKGSMTDVVYDVAQDSPGCYIREVEHPGNATGGKNETINRDSPLRHEWHGTGQSGFLKNADCRADTKGKDNEKLGCRNITYSVHHLNVKLWPETILGPPGPAMRSAPRTPAQGEVPSYKERVPIRR